MVVREVGECKDDACTEGHICAVCKNVDQSLFHSHLECFCHQMVIESAGFEHSKILAAMLRWIGVSGLPAVPCLRDLVGVQPVDEYLDCKCQRTLYMKNPTNVQMPHSTSSSLTTPSCDSFQDPFSAFLKYSEYPSSSARWTLYLIFDAPITTTTHSLMRAAVLVQGSAGIPAVLAYDVPWTLRFRWLWRCHRV